MESATMTEPPLLGGDGICVSELTQIWGAGLARPLRGEAIIRLHEIGTVQARSSLGRYRRERRIGKEHVVDASRWSPARSGGLQHLTKHPRAYRVQRAVWRCPRRSDDYCAQFHHL